MKLPFHRVHQARASRPCSSAQNHSHVGLDARSYLHIRRSNPSKGSLPNNGPSVQLVMVRELLGGIPNCHGLWRRCDRSQRFEGEGGYGGGGGAVAGALEIGASSSDSANRSIGGPNGVLNGRENVIIEALKSQCRLWTWRQPGFSPGHSILAWIIMELSAGIKIS